MLVSANEALTRFLPAQLDRLRAALSAQPVTIQSIPASIRRDWVLPDGRARLQITPKPEASGGPALKQFVAEVSAAVPEAGGSAVTIIATSETIVTAFRDAAIAAVLMIAVILFATLRRLLDGAVVMSALLLSALLTVVVCLALPLPLNFANIIALPLLLGGGRVVQHLFRDELAGGGTVPAGFGDGSGGDFLGVDDGDGIWLAGAVAASGDGEHGGAAADQPGLHAAGVAGLRAGAACVLADARGRLGWALDPPTPRSPRM